MSRRSRALWVGLAAVALIGSAAPAASAQPATRTAAVDNCTFSGTLCLYAGTNFTGENIALISFKAGGTCVNLASEGWSQRAKSARNKNRNSAALFMNENCQGDPYQVAPNSGVADLGGFKAKSAWVPYLIG